MRRKKARRRSNSKKFGNLWLVTAVLLILFIAGLYYLKDHGKRRPVEHAVSKEKTHRMESKTKEVTNKTATTGSQPQFDFYNMLSQPQSGNNASKATPGSSTNTPGNTIPAPKTPVKNVSTPTTKSNIKLQTPLQTTPTSENKKDTTHATKYVLQVASLKDLQKIDELKAELTLNGFNVTTEKVKKGDAIEYRINVGPYNSLKSATAEQRRLRRTNMESILVKTK